MVYSGIIKDSKGVAITATSLNSGANYALDVNIVGGSSGATVDESTFTAGTSTFSPDGGVFNDGLAAITSGQQGTNRMTSFRALHVNLRNNAGVQYGDSQTDGFNVIIGDGTNTPAVKAASTVPLAADKSLVVSLSPNSPVFGTVGAGTAASQSVLGGGVFNTTPPTLTTGQQAAFQLDSAGNLKISLAASSDATPIPVSNSYDISSTSTAPSAATQALTAATDVTILSANTARKGLYIQNVSVTPCFIGLGAAASATNWNIQLDPGEVWEPQKTVYTGAIHAFSTLLGSIKVTELS